MRGTKNLGNDEQPATTSLPTLKSTAAQFEADFDDLRQRLDRLRSRIPALHQELRKLDQALVEVSEQDFAGKGQNSSQARKAELLTKRTLLEAELASLPGQAAALKIRIVHADLLLLRSRRELFKAQAYRLQQEFATLERQRSIADTERHHVKVLARHHHISPDEAAVQAEPLIGQLRDLEPQVRTARAELSRAQSRAGSQNDTAKLRYGLGIDADPQKWDAIAQRLADELREEMFVECFPLLRPQPLRQPEERRVRSW